MLIKKTLSISIKILFTGGIFYYLIQSDRLQLDRLGLLIEKPSLLLTLVFVILLVVLPLSAVRWWLFLQALSVNLSIKNAFFLTWIGNFFNSTLPGAISGDLVKGFYTYKKDTAEGKSKTFMTLLIDRFSGLFGLVVMAFFALLFNRSLITDKASLEAIAILISLLFVFTLIFYIVVLYPFKEGRDPFIRIITRLPKSRFLLNVYCAFKGYQDHWKILLSGLLISIFIHSCVAYLFLLISQELGITSLTLADQMLIMPIVFISIAIPLAPGGVGVGHAAFAALYLMMGIQGGADVFNLYVVTQLAINLLGDIVYIAYGSEYRHRKEKQQDAKESIAP